MTTIEFTDFDEIAQYFPKTVLDLAAPLGSLGNDRYVITPENKVKLLDVISLEHPDLDVYELETDNQILWSAMKNLPISKVKELIATI